MRNLGRTGRLILTVLAREPSHGYGVILWAKNASGGSEQLSVGSVYGSMDKLEEKGLIEHDHDDVENGRTRRYFRITEEGRTRLTKEVNRLANEVQAAQAALNIAPPLAGPGGLAGQTL